MHINIISSLRSAHQLTHQSAIAEGFNAIGVSTELHFQIETIKSRYVAVWGWRNGKILRDRGHEVLVMERGYLGDRFSMTSLAWNGLNGNATFPPSRQDGGARFRNIADMKPWNDGGDYGLIMGQVPNDASLCGVNLMPWYDEMSKAIHNELELPVKFRQHPEVTKRGSHQTVAGAEKSTGSLEHELSRAAVAVCYNSNSSVDSILAGVPCVVDNSGSMAWAVASRGFSQLVRPEREQWAHDLAWKQWTLLEITSGQALKGVVEIAA